MVVYTPFRTNIVVGTSGEVAETNALHRWQNTGTLRAPDPLGGGSSDVANFEEWLGGTPAGSTIEFPPGMTYLQNAMVRYLPVRRYAWPGTDEPSTKWQVISGTNMGTAAGMWVPQVWDSNSSVGQNPVEFIHPCLDGNKASATGSAHGLIMYGSHWWRIYRPYIFNQRNNGIHLTNLAKNGSTVGGGDAADGGIFDVRLSENLGHGICQDLAVGANAHNDVQVIGGRIFNNTKSGILGDALAGWLIDNVFFFANGEHNIASIDGWFDTQIYNTKHENFGNGQSSGTWAGIYLKGYQHGTGNFKVEGNQFACIRSGNVEETGPDFRYIWLDAFPGAGNTAVGSCANNTITGGGRSGVYGIYKWVDSGTLRLAGSGTNSFFNVAIPNHVHLQSGANYFDGALGETSPGFTSESGTTYTLLSTDAERSVEFTSASSVTVTVPANSTTAFPIGTVIEVVRMGAGSVTLSAAGGVTIRTPGTLVLRAQYSSVTIRKRATDEWVLAGDTT